MRKLILISACILTLTGCAAESNSNQIQTMGFDVDVKNNPISLIVGDNKMSHGKPYYGVIKDSDTGCEYIVVSRMEAVAVTPRMTNPDFGSNLLHKGCK